MLKKLSAVSDATIDWLGRGFHTVIPEVFIAGGIVTLVIVWWILARWYQRCPHCHRFVRRAYAGSRQCPRCGRQYYYGLRAMR